MEDRGIHILLVEDNPSDAELAFLLMKKSLPQASISHANDGAKAIDLLREENLPRLILLDLELPRMDGFEVLKTIRENPRTKSIPVVILSSSDDERDRQKCRDLGASSYIVKPMNFVAYREAFLSSCRQWLELPEIGATLFS